MNCSSPARWKESTTNAEEFPMSALRKEEPLTTADIAGHERTGARPDDAVIDRTNANPADRRRPRSVEAGDAAAYNNDARVTAADTDDIYDGEVVSSTVEPSTQSATPSRQRNQESAFSSPHKSGFERPVSQRPPNSSADLSTVGTSTATETPAGRDESPSVAPLFPEDELRDFRARWDQVQTSFVDEPRRAVEQADTLVATVVKRIAEQFAEERAKLEQQWDRGDDISTEELRQGLKRYRAFFDRLLSF
jgi:hypothetical protein